MHPQVVTALRRLEKERRTGVFKTSAGDVRREVRLEAGGIVAARSSSLEDRLGEFMVRRGRINQQELDDASILVRGGRRLGEALVELRIIASDEVQTFVRGQLAEIASKILNEPTKKLEFKNEAPMHKVTEIPVPIADAIIEAARQTASVVAEVERLLDENMVPAFTVEAYAVLETLNLHSHEAFVLSRCDGQSDVRSIFAQSPLSDEDTARIILGLEQAGIVEMKNVTVGH